VRVPPGRPTDKRIVTLAGRRDESGFFVYLLEVNVADATAKEVPGVRWYQGAQVAWLPDGTGLVVVAKERIAAPYQVWMVAYPSGQSRRLTNDLLDYDKVSLSADGRLLVIQQVDDRQSYLGHARGGHKSRPATDVRHNCPRRHWWSRLDARWSYPVYLDAEWGNGYLDDELRWDRAPVNSLPIRVAQTGDLGQRRTGATLSSRPLVQGGRTFGAWTLMVAIPRA